MCKEVIVLFKKLAMVVVAVLGLLVFFQRYMQINQQYPRTEEVKIPIGEEVEFKDDVMLSVLEHRIWDDKEANDFYAENEEEQIYETKIVEVVVEVENKSPIEEEIHLYNLYLETLGFKNGVMNIQVLSSDIRDRAVQKLQPNEVRTIEMLYEILLYRFPKSDWDKLEDYDMWLTFALYPEKKMLLLK